jgi:hypothetical protein
MSKISNNLFVLFVAVLIWQSSCDGGNRSDHGASELEAQSLLDSGITFDFTFNADGFTEDGGAFTGHGYITSDGVKIDKPWTLPEEGKR